MEAQKTKLTFEQQKRKWPAIVAWCRVMQSFEYYLRLELNLAEETNAPNNAIYHRVEKKTIVWHTSDGITNPDLQYIKELTTK